MKDNFYSTLAQVLPLLLLAFIWDSGFLARLRQQRRLPKKVDPSGVRFWFKPRVRIYTLTVVGVVIVSTAVAVFVLGGVIPDSYALRLALSIGLVLVLITLLTRIAVDVFWATAVPKPNESPGRPPDSPSPPVPITAPETLNPGHIQDAENSSSGIPDESS
jgi:hypothetical protein